MLAKSRMPNIYTFLTPPSFGIKQSRPQIYLFFSTQNFDVCLLFTHWITFNCSVSFFFWWAHWGLKGHWQHADELMKTWWQLTNKSRHSHVCRPYDVGGGSFGHWGADVVWKRLYSQRAGRGLCWQTCRSVGGDAGGSFSRSWTRLWRSSVQLLARNNASTTCVCLCVCVEKTDLMHAACCCLPRTLSHRWTKRQSCSWRSFHPFFILRRV